MSRRKPSAPWRKVVWIGVSAPGSQGGKVWTLVLECGHIAHRHYPEPKPHSIFRRMPMAPHKCRCTSCEIGSPPADPQGWIAVLEQRHAP